MKNSSLTLATAAAAALISVIACNRNELTAVNADSKPQSITEAQGGASIGEGRAMTQEEVAQLMAMQKNSPVIALQTPSAAPAPLAKTAAATLASLTSTRRPNWQRSPTTARAPS